MRLELKQRLAGFLFLTVVAPMALLGYLIIVVIGTVGSVARVQGGVRALDHFVNATIFNGYAWESVSSHAWRERDKTWAKWIIAFTGMVQKNHCQRANKREQEIVDLVLAKGLDKQTL